MEKVASFESCRIIFEYMNFIRAPGEANLHNAPCLLSLIWSNTFCANWMESISALLFNICRVVLCNEVPAISLEENYEAIQAPARVTTWWSCMDEVDIYKLYNSCF